MSNLAQTNIQASQMRLQQADMARIQQQLQQTQEAGTAGDGSKRDLNMEKIDAAAKDFEAMFLTEMLRPMFEEIKPDPMFGGGKGEEVFQGLMLEEYGKVMVDAGGVGLAEHIKAEMIRIQEEMQK